MTTDKPKMARIAGLIAIPMAMVLGLSIAPSVSAAQSAAAPAAAPVAAVVPQAAVGVAAGFYNLAAISGHNLQADCWVAISKNVYNLTGFMSVHSGGASKITPVCGKDGTSTFTGKHSSLTTSVGGSTFGTVLNAYLLAANAYDAVVPATPAGLVATPGDGQVALTWTATADGAATTTSVASGVASYQIFQGGVQVGTSATASYTATGLTNGTSYAFTIKAVDTAGNISAASAATNSTPVGALPAAPTGLTATAGDGQVALSWTASAGATSYQIFNGATQVASQAGTTYTATGLTNGTLYSFTVKATNASGQSAASSAATATPVAIPAPPTGLTATPGSGQVALSWTASAGATSYQVFNGATQVVSQAGTTYTVTGLTNGTAYTFTVKASSATGQSAASASASATPVAIPAAPTGLAATAGDTQVSLSWTASAGATSYQIFNGATQVASQAGTTYTATGLTNGTLYSFTVKATNAAGQSAASAAATATPMPPVPSAPTGLVATPGDAQVTLAWTATAGATSYQVFNGATQIATPAVNSYVVTGLTNGTLYSFTVKAVNASGASVASAAATATPVVAGTAPAAPTGLTATPGSGQVVLSWTASAGATSYQVFNGATQVASQAGTTYTATGLTNGTAYTFTVKATNAIGQSAASSSVSSTPVAVPAAPTGLTATAGAGQVALSWTASAGATSYQVFNGATQVVSQAGTTYTVTGLTNGTLYSFTVKATNGSGQSGASAAATATPVAIPAAPTGLTATAGAAQVALSWTASAGATSYQVFNGATQVASQAGTTYTATGLTNGTLYSFTVKATNGSGQSAASAAATATPVAIPAAPTGLTATAGAGQVALSWTASAGATSYQVFNGATQVVSQAGTTYTVTGLTNGTLYSFTVKATNGSGQSAASAAATATPAAIPAAPADLTATAGAAQVALSWTASAGATSYQVFRGATQIASQAGTTYTATGLTNGTLYSFTVKASNGSGQSAASAAATATPLAIPAAPTGLSATAGNAQVVLSWTASAGATSYDVYQGVNLLVTQPETTYTATGLTNDTLYSFTVKASNASGTSAASAAATATPTAPTGSFTLTQVGTHNTPADCWVAIAGKVYNLTAFLGTHSGGSGPISGVCGGDGTTTFYTQHGNSADAKTGILGAYLLGDLSGYVAAPLPAQAPAPSVGGVAGGGEYTMADVQKHASAGDCWSVVDGNVYDLTSWVGVHPGGSSVVSAMCGIDGSGMYNGKHGSSASAGAIMAKLKMGPLVASKGGAAQVVTYAATDVTKHSTPADCWSIVDGVMYDLTAWIGKHPGGPDVIVAMCGKDGSAMYNGKHGSNAGATALLGAYKLGAVEGTLPAEEPTTSASGPIVKLITARRVMAHNEASDCWSIVNGNVYNLTAWTSRHPNRKSFIQAMCGANGTKAFNKASGSVAKSNKMLKRYLIGRVGRPAAPAAPTTPDVTYTMVDVAAHKAAATCWSAVNGNVYDLTKWIPLHPGGSSSITAMCGKDGSASYNAMHKGSAKAATALAQYAIGKLG